MRITLHMSPARTLIDMRMSHDDLFHDLEVAAICMQPNLKIALTRLSYVNILQSMQAIYNN